MSSDQSVNWSNYSNEEGIRNESISDILRRFSKWASEVLINESLSKSPSLLQNMTFLDVACGWGYLSMELLLRLQEQQQNHSILLSTQTSPITQSFIVTDYAEGMVEKSNTNLTHLIKERDYPLTHFECKVMDGCHPTIASNSITHLGCMFGIMFFPDLDTSLIKLHETLTSDGIAVFGTWKRTDTQVISMAFRSFLGFHENDAIIKLNQTVSVCSTDEDFIHRLEAAGYHQIQILNREEIFYVQSKDFFHTLVRNPVLQPFFENLSEDILWIRWIEFFQTEQAKEWIVSDQTNMLRIKMHANLGVCKK